MRSNEARWPKRPGRRSTGSSTRRSRRSVARAGPSVARPRAVRLRSSFTADVAQQVGSLVRHRSVEEIARLRAALDLLRTRLGRNPGLGQEQERRGSTSYPVTPIGQALPYLVWYSYDGAHARSPVWLLMLRHEKQDRPRMAHV